MSTLPRGIRQRGSGFLVDATYKGKRATATVTEAGNYGSLIEAAKAKRIELLNGMMHGGSGRDVGSKTGKVWSLGDAYDRTVTSVWAGTPGEHTARRNAETALAHFGRSRKLDSLGTESIDLWVAELVKAGNSNATINRKLAALSKMLTVAVQRGGLQAKPHMPRRKESQGRIRYLSDGEEAEVLRLLNQWGRQDEADAVVVLIDTGLRHGELLRLESRDVDLKRGLLHVWQTKADQPRSIPMTKRVRAIVERRMARGRLFPYDAFWLRHTWDRVRSHMGLADDPQFVPHALRHTCASRLVQRGVGLAVVQQWLGHKTIAITMRYAHLSPNSLTDAAGVLEQKEAAE